MQQQQRTELRDWFLSLPQDQQRLCLDEMSLSPADIVANLSSNENRLWFSEAMRICIMHGHGNKGPTLEEATKIKNRPGFKFTIHPRQIKALASLTSALERHISVARSGLHKAWPTFQKPQQILPIQQFITEDVGSLNIMFLISRSQILHPGQQPFPDPRNTNWLDMCRWRLNCTQLASILAMLWGRRQNNITPPSSSPRDIHEQWHVAQDHVIRTFANIQATISKQRTSAWSEHTKLLKKGCEFFPQTSQLENSKQITSLLQQSEGEVDHFETRFKLYKAEQSQQPQSDDPGIREAQDRKSGLRGVEMLKSHWDSLKMRLFLWKRVCTQTRALDDARVNAASSLVREALVLLQKSQGTQKIVSRLDARLQQHLKAFANDWLSDDPLSFQTEMQKNYDQILAQWQGCTGLQEQCKLMTSKSFHAIVKRMDNGLREQCLRVSGRMDKFRHTWESLMIDAMVEAIKTADPNKLRRQKTGDKRAAATGFEAKLADRLMAEVNAGMAKLKACFADYCLGIYSGMESICTALAKVPLEKLHAVQLARVGRPMANPFASPQQHDKPRIDYAALHTSPILAPRSSPLLGTPPSLSIDEMGDKTQTQLRALSHEQVIQVATEFRAKIYHLERERSVQNVYIKQLMDKINYLTQQLRNSAGPMHFPQSPENSRHAFRNGGTPPRHPESSPVGATGPRPSPITSESASMAGHQDTTPSPVTSSATSSYHRYSNSRHPHGSPISPVGSGFGPVASKTAEQKRGGSTKAAPYTRTNKPRQRGVSGSNSDSDERSKRGNSSMHPQRKGNQAAMNNSDSPLPQRTQSKRNTSKNGQNNRGKGRSRTRSRGRGRGNNRNSRRSTTKKPKSQST